MKTLRLSLLLGLISAFFLISCKDRTPEQAKEIRRILIVDTDSESAIRSFVYDQIAKEKEMSSNMLKDITFIPAIDMVTIERIKHDIVDRFSNDYEQRVCFLNGDTIFLNNNSNLLIQENDSLSIVTLIYPQNNSQVCFKFIRSYDLLSY